MPFKYKKRSKKAPFLKNPIFLVIAVVLVAAGVFGALEKTGVINVFHKRNPGLATQPVTAKRTGGADTKGDTGQPAENTGAEDQNKMPTDTPNAPLKEPSGTFVSNHHPNLSGNPSPNDMQSSCTTTSGATCTIVFTKGSDVKQLPVQNTDLEGAAYWSWKLQDIGLTAGTWKVQAKAVSGSQVKTTNDAIDLVVSP